MRPAGQDANQCQHQDHDQYRSDHICSLFISWDRIGANPEEETRADNA